MIKIMPVYILFRRKILYFTKKCCRIFLGNTSGYVPGVPRPKLERPDPIPWPDLSAGQAERLRRTRAQRGYSLRHLAALSGVSPPTIRSIEAGGKGAPRSDVLAALADALGIARGWLAYGG